VRNDDALLVHASLKSLGFVIGGAVAVVQALLDVVGPGGTIVVPTFTADNSDPSRWALTRKQPVPEEWWPTIRENLPAFDPEVTPSNNIGAIAEAVRTWPGAQRSYHPQTSFAALGAKAEELTRDHHWDCHLGPNSPLGRLAETNAKILLLGVGYEVCSAFHLAEYLVPNPPQRDYECVVTENGERTWYRYRDVALDDSDFDRIGAAMEAAGNPPVQRAQIGAATCRLFPLRDAVEFAKTWMIKNRQQSPS
jgi:aminoglycoside 3-N-acetyltransferase